MSARPPTKRRPRWATTASMSCRSSSRWLRLYPLRRLSLRYSRRHQHQPPVPLDRHQRPSAADVAVVVNEWDSPGPAEIGYQWTTYPERLEASGVSWKVYQFLPDNLPTTRWRVFANTAPPAFRWAIGAAAERLQRLRAYRDALNEARHCTKAARQHPAADGNDLDAMLAGFRSDVQQGKLPQVSWIIAPAAYSEHRSLQPGAGRLVHQDPQRADRQPGGVGKTVLLVNYDETTAFDHMPSPSAPSLREDGSFAGKSTVPFDTGSSSTWRRPVRRINRRRDGIYGPARGVPMLVLSPGAAAASG